MTNAPTAVRLISLLLFLFVAGGSAQTVTFSVARAEMQCPLPNKQVVRLLFDTSLKDHLDAHRFEESLDCAGTKEPDPAPVPPHPCSPYWAVEKLFTNSFSETTPNPKESQKQGHGAAGVPWTEEVPEKSYATNFYLVELKSGNALHLNNEFLLDDIIKNDPLPDDPAKPSHLTLEYSALHYVDPSKTYVLMANVQKLADGKPDANTHIVKLDITSSCTLPPKELKPPPTKEQEEQEKIDKEKNNDVLHYLTESKNSKAANVGVSFGMKGSKGSYIYSHDIALRIGRLHRIGLWGAYDINWFFLDHKYSNDSKSPLDDLKFGIKANHLLHDPFLRREKSERDIINSITTTITGRIETDFRFSDQVNFVAGWQSGLPINIFNERSTMARFTPFIGYEMGYRIKDETPIGKNKFISRGLFGINIFVAPFRKEKVNPFEVEVEYIRRVLAREEPEYYVNVDDKEVFGSFNRRPKDFGKVRLTFNYNNTFSPFIQYSYGKVPGKYLLQNNAIEAGLKVYLKWSK